MYLWAPYWEGRVHKRQLEEETLVLCVQLRMSLGQNEDVFELREHNEVIDSHHFMLLLSLVQ